jgi:hypothetical protein
MARGHWHAENGAMFDGLQVFPAGQSLVLLHPHALPPLPSTHVGPAELPAHWASPLQPQV